MASLFVRDGGIYYAQWKDARRKPVKKVHSLGTADRRTAAALLRELDRAYTLGNWDPWLHMVREVHQRPEEFKTVDDVVGLFLADRERSGLSAETVKLYRSDLGILMERVGCTKRLARLAKDELEAFVKDPRLARSTQQKRYRVARAFLNWAVRAGHLEQNPILSVAPPKGKSTVPRAIKREDLDAICMAIQSDYDRRRRDSKTFGPCAEGDLVWCTPLFWFAFYTGMRISEVARLRWGHVDPENRLIYILQQKSGEQSTIPLTTRAEEILSGLPGGVPDEFVFVSPYGDRFVRSTPAFKNRVTKIFCRYRRAAGLPDRITFHSTRHGFCTMLAMAGKSAYVIKAAARHSHVQTSMRYVDVANDFLKGELDSVFT